MGSLLSFIRIPEVNKKFNETFPKPSFKYDPKIIAPPLTNNYSLVGTAFDYLMRFYLKYLNPEAIESSWVAEHGVGILKLFELARVAENGEELLKMLESIFGNKLLINIEKDAIEKIDSIIQHVKTAFTEYLQTGNMKDELIELIINLAKIDLIIRVGIIEPTIGVVNKNDIEDLRKLVSIVDQNKFKSKKICVLNPTFGEGSILVGGADSDLLLDNTLIDIKTVKSLEFEKRSYNQLIGYYILYTVGGIDYAPSALIENVGIYYSRYAILHTIPVKTFTDNPNFPQFREWFINKAKEVTSSTFPKPIHASDIEKNMIQARMNQEHDSMYDPIINQFLKAIENLVEVRVKDHEPNYLLIKLQNRIDFHNLNSKIETYMVNNVVYLKKK